MPDNYEMEIFIVSFTPILFGSIHTPGYSLKDLKNRVALYNFSPYNAKKQEYILDLYFSFVNFFGYENAI